MKDSHQTGNPKARINISLSLLTAPNPRRMRS